MFKDSDNIVDLSGEMYNGMWSYDVLIDNPQTFNIERFASLDKQGFDSSNISFCSISGTYLETSAHLYPDREMIADVDAKRLISRAKVLKVAKGARQAIKAQDIDLSGINMGDSLIVATGYDENWDSPDYVLNSPYFSMEAVEKILEVNPSIIGGDFPLFDDHKNPVGINKKIFEERRLLLAPLVNCVGLPDFVTLAAMPLKLKDCTACPARVVAIY